MTLKELLNKLIEKGWKPKNREKYGEVSKCKVMGIPGYVHIMFLIKGEEYGNYGMNLRELVAKDTGLWQFVCENDYWVCKDTYFVEKYTDHIAIHLYQCNDYRYWLLGSALTDEDKLEQFLLDNIKIDE